MKHVFLAAFLLASCGFVPLDTAWQLRAVTPLTLDPQTLQAELLLPQGVNIAQAGTTLFLGATRGDTGAEVGQSFPLETVNTAPGRVQLQLAANDRAAFQALQDQISGWKDTAPDATEGTFSITVAACQTGTGPAPDATFSVSLLGTTPDDALPVLVDVPVAQAVAAGALAQHCD